MIIFSTTAVCEVVEDTSTSVKTCTFRYNDVLYKEPHRTAAKVFISWDGPVMERNGVYNLTGEVLYRPGSVIEVSHIDFLFSTP